MKKYYSIFFVLLLIFTAAVPASFVGAQSNSQFTEIIQKISSSENLTSQEKNEIMDKAIDLHYDEGISLDQISEVLDQNDNYDDIDNQFINLDISFDDDQDDNDRDDMDDDDDDDMDDDDDDEYDDDDDDEYDDDDDDEYDDDDDDDYDDDDDNDDDDDEEDDD